MNGSRSAVEIPRLRGKGFVDWRREDFHHLKSFKNKNRFFDPYFYIKEHSRLLVLKLLELMSADRLINF